jgi:hypothetical protein
MKNLTITLPDDVARRLRIEAAKAGKSMSRYVADLVGRQPASTAVQREALDRFLAGPPMDLTDAAGRAPRRADLYDADDLR